jgi:hypothetical protein
MQCELNFLDGAFDGARLLLAGGFLRVGDAHAHFAGLRWVECRAQRGANTHLLRIAGEHFRPRENLNAIEQCSIRAKPCEEQAE